MLINRDLGVGVDPFDNNSLPISIKNINFKLASLALPLFEGVDNTYLHENWSIIEQIQEKKRLLSNHLCPIDSRLQEFLNKYLDEVKSKTPILPNETLILDKFGLAKVLSFPADKEGNISKKNILKKSINYAKKNTDVAYIVDGFLSGSSNYKITPKNVFSNLLEMALNPPKDFLKLPLTTLQPSGNVKTFVSLLLRPLEAPKEDSGIDERSMEIKIIAPGKFVSNLDYLESIYGNPGNPLLPQNDSALNCKNWSGVSGCLILAPHLIKVKKKDIGLPNRKQATDKQIQDSMFWEHEDDCFNKGEPFKLTARDDSGTIITILCDSSFESCQNEVLTQIKYSELLTGVGECSIQPSYLNNTINIQELSEQISNSINTNSNYGTLPEYCFINRMFLSFVFSDSDFSDIKNIFLEKNVIESYKKIAYRYIDNGDVKFMCPPVKEIIYMISNGGYNKTIYGSPNFRNMFNKKEILKTDWYKQRLEVMQDNSIRHYEGGLNYIKNYLKSGLKQDCNFNAKVQKEFLEMGSSLLFSKSNEYREKLNGNICIDELKVS